MMEWIAPRSYVPGTVSSFGGFRCLWIQHRLASVIVPLQCVLRLLRILQVAHHFGRDCTDGLIDFLPVYLFPDLILLKSTYKTQHDSLQWHKCYSIQRAPVGKSMIVHLRKVDPNHVTPLEKSVKGSKFLCFKSLTNFKHSISLSIPSPYYLSHGTLQEHVYAEDVMAQYRSCL